MSNARIATNVINPALLPLLSTTATATLALAEYDFLTKLMKASQTQSGKYSSAVARTISTWWKQSPGLAIIISLALTSLVTGGRTARLMPPSSPRRWTAIAGTLLAVGHFAFGPKIVAAIQDMKYGYERAGIWQAEALEAGKTEEEVADERVLDAQKRWLRLHVWRTMLADIPALGCFASLVFGS